MNQALLDELQKIADRIPEIDSERQYWFIRTNGGRFYDDFYYNKSVGIGYNLVSLPQVRKALDHEPNPYGELVKIILDKYPEDFDSKNIGKPAGLFYRFYEEMKEGDVVVMPYGSAKYAFGVVTGGEPFEVDSSSFDDNEIYRKRRPVEWIVQKDFSELDSKLYQAFRSPQALSTLNSYASFIDREMHSVYTKDGKTHFRLNINAEGAIDGNDYFPMGSILLGLTEEFRQAAGINEAFREIDVRQNVQSKGLVEFISKHQMLTVFLVCATIVGLDGGSFEIEKIGLKLGTPGFIPEMLSFYKEHHKDHNVNTVLAGKLAGVDAKLTPDVLRIVAEQAPAEDGAAKDAPPAASADTAATASSSAKATIAATASLAKPGPPATLADSTAKDTPSVKPAEGKP